MSGADSDEEDQQQPLPPRTDRDYMSPSPEFDNAGRSDNLRRIVRYEEHHQSTTRVAHPSDTQHHKRALSEATKEATEPSSVKVQKVAPSQSTGGRARRGDYEQDVQEVIKISQALLRIKLYTIDAFPTAAQLLKWITEVWNEANTRVGTDYDKSLEIHKMVRAPL